MDKPGSASWTGDLWGGLAAMLVALPSAIAFGVTIFSPLGAGNVAHGALAGIIGATVLGLVAPALGGTDRLITAPCAPAAAVLVAVAIDLARQGVGAEAGMLLLMLIGLLAGLIQIVLGLVGVGRLIKYIPYSVVCGYLSGVGLTIIGGQLPRVLGVPREMGFWQALTTPSAWHWQSIVVGTVVVATMALVPRVIRVVPAAIIAMLAGVAAYLLLGLADPALWTAAGNPLLIGPLGVAAGGLPDALLHNLQALGDFDPAGCR